MTDGILLAETQSDPLLRAYDTLIIDEAHERSLNIDFLLGYLQQLLPRRPDLKVIVTSATIDADRFAQHFASARRAGAGDRGVGPAVPGGAALAARSRRRRELRPERRHRRRGRRTLARRRAAATSWSSCPASARSARRPTTCASTWRTQPLARTPRSCRCSRGCRRRSRTASSTAGSGRRIVLATNVAETSLTVPGIRYVIDAGLARVKRYSYRNKVEQLQVEPISQAAANQRAGRCGRVANGICIRLYDEKDFAGRPRFTDPEILRSSLAGVILRMKSLRPGRGGGLSVPRAAAAQGHRRRLRSCSASWARSTTPTS